MKLFKRRLIIYVIYMDKKRKRDETQHPQKKIKYDICVICLESMKDNTMDLPCGHTFHKNCIDPWICKKNTCPCCRKPVNEILPIEEYLLMDPIELDNFLFPLVVEV